MALFNFFKGIAASIAQKTSQDNQILFAEDTGVLSFDIDDGENTVNRYEVRDPEVKAKLEGQTVLIL